MRLVGAAGGALGRDNRAKALPETRFAQSEDALRPESLACGSQLGERGESATPQLRFVPAVETLRRVWVQQYYMQSGLVHWRTDKEGIPPARLIVSSPYDVEARLGRKRKTQWVGYKVYLTADL